MHCDENTIIHLFKTEKIKPLIIHNLNDINVGI